jgi:hypothetical protein
MFTKGTLLRALLLAPWALAVSAPDKSSTEIHTIAHSSGSVTGNDSISASANGIDFSKWALQLPIGTPGKPQTVAGSSLKTYSDPKKQYYYTDPTTRAVVMKVPGSPASTGCVHTTNSKHCRTELRETTPASWDPKASTNRLTSTLTVVKADDSAHGTCIGQIHIADSVSVRPVCELYYSSKATSP